MIEKPRPLIDHELTEPQISKAYLYRRIVRAKMYIDAHYDRSICLESMAEEANFSKFHFIRLFRSIYKKTPHQYLTLVRIQQATKLLRAGKTPTHACFAVGFISLSSFGVLFRRKQNMSPSDFYKHGQELRLVVSQNPRSLVSQCLFAPHGWGQQEQFPNTDDPICK